MKAGADEEELRMLASVMKILVIMPPNPRIYPQGSSTESDSWPKIKPKVINEQHVPVTDCGNEICLLVAYTPLGMGMIIKQTIA